MPANFAFDLLQHRAATLAHRGIGGILAHVNRIIPAALTLLAIGAAYIRRVTPALPLPEAAFSSVTAETMNR